MYINPSRCAPGVESRIWQRATTSLSDHGGIHRRIGTLAIKIESDHVSPARTPWYGLVAVNPLRLHALPLAEGISIISHASQCAALCLSHHRCVIVRIHLWTIKIESCQILPARTPSQGLMAVYPSLIYWNPLAIHPFCHKWGRPYGHGHRSCRCAPWPSSCHDISGSRRRAYRSIARCAHTSDALIDGDTAGIGHSLPY